MTRRVRQTQITLPLFRVLSGHPDGLPAGDAVAAVADELGLSREVRDASATLPCGDNVNLFARDVRWARQRAKLHGQIDGTVRNLWRLTPRGERDLRLATPGIVLTVIESAQGQAVWAEAESALRLIDSESVALWLTSPPYDLQRQKAYGGRSGDEYLDWLTEICAEMRRTLAPDGSIVLNLADAFNAGKPTLNLYQERLLLRLCDELNLHLAQRLIWHNPAKLPAPAEWVTIRRCRLTPATETLFWLSKSEFPKADNRRVLRPYSSAMRSVLARGGEAAAHRPSGHAIADGAFRADNGGSIPHNLIEASHTTSNDAYMRHCRSPRQDGGCLPIHPARFPEELAELPIKLLTEPGDLVGDCFAGSCTTGAVAERLGRRWLCIEHSLTYLQGALGRFNDATALPAA